MVKMNKREAQEHDLGYKAVSYFKQTIILGSIFLFVSVLSGWLVGTPNGSLEIIRLSIQAIIITLATILPLSMYAYFAKTRHPVIWQEFVQNLLRLGMKPQSYNQRFQAVYGGEGSKDAAIQMPIYLNAIIWFVGWWLVFYPASNSDNRMDIFVNPNANLLVFGFLGAYTQSLLIFVRRFLNDDLKPKVFSTATERVLLAFAIALVIYQVKSYFSPAGQENLMFALMFFLGMYPDIGILLLESFVKWAFGVFTGFRDQYPLHRIQGLTRLDRERLKEENIDNIQHLATADLVDLLLKTRYPSERIVDWVDQAILQFHLTPESGKVSSPNTPPVSKDAAADKGKKNELSGTAASSGEEGSKEGLPSKIPSAMVDNLQEMQGTKNENPMQGFYKIGIRTATDLISVDRAMTGTDPKGFEEVIKSVKPGINIRLLITALAEDANIVHIRHWREHEYMAIAETADRILSRADSVMEEAGKSVGEEKALELYKKAADLYEESRKEYQAESGYISALLGHGRALAGQLAAWQTLKRNRKSVDDAALFKIQKQAVIHFTQAMEADPSGNDEARLERLRVLINGGLFGFQEEINYRFSPEEEIQKLLANPRYQSMEVWKYYLDIVSGTIDLARISDTVTETIKHATTDQEKSKWLRFRAAYLSPEDALADYMMALELSPNDRGAVIDFVYYLEKNRDYDKAINVLKDWINRISRMVVTERSRWIGDAYTFLGKMYMHKKDYESALDALYKARKMPMNLEIDFQPPLDMIEAIYTEQKAYDKLGEFFSEVGVFEGASRAFRMAGQLDHARAELQKHETLNPKLDEDHYFELSILNACEGNSRQATSILFSNVDVDIILDKAKWLKSEAVCCENAKKWSKDISLTLKRAKEINTLRTAGSFGLAIATCSGFIKISSTQKRIIFQKQLGNMEQTLREKLLEAQVRDFIVTDNNSIQFKANATLQSEYLRGWIALKAPELYEKLRQEFLYYLGGDDWSILLASFEFSDLDRLPDAGAELCQAFTSI